MRNENSDADMSRSERLYRSFLEDEAAPDFGEEAITLARAVLTEHLNTVACAFEAPPREVKIARAYLRLVRRFVKG